MGGLLKNSPHAPSPLGPNLYRNVLDSAKTRIITFAASRIYSARVVPLWTDEMSSPPVVSSTGGQVQKRFRSPYSVLR